MSKNYLEDKKELKKESEMLLKFKVPAREFSKIVEEAAREFSKDMKVAGFRPGKVPVDMVEKEIGIEKLVAAAAEKAVKKFYVNAILEEEIGAIGEPKIEIKKIAKGNDLEFEARIAVLPEFELKNWQGPIKKINGKFIDKKPKVEEGEIQHELDFLAKQRAKVVTVNREAADGDQVEVDFQVFIDNVAIENGTAKKHPVVIGEKKFIPGFEEQLVGMKADEEKEFKLKFPKEYQAKDLAGKEALFKVKVGLVQEREIPNIDDELASGIGKFKNLDELKKNIKEGIEHEKKNKLEDENKKEILDELVSESDFSVPDLLVERELAAMMGELEQDIARIGLTKEKYLQNLKKTEEELKVAWKKEQAPKRVKAALILRQLAKDNDFKPEAEKVEERVNQVLQYYTATGQDKDKLDVAKLYEAAKGNLANEKVFEFLMGMK